MIPSVLKPIPPMVNQIMAMLVLVTTLLTSNKIVAADKDELSFERYQDLVIVNSRGEIEIKARIWMAWRDDGERFAELLDIILEDLEKTCRTCERLGHDVFFDETASVAGLLHPVTENTLTTLSWDGEDIRLFDILKTTFSRYAGKVEHEEPYPRGLIGSYDCYVYFRNRLPAIERYDEIKSRVEKVCKKTRETESCLNDIFTRNKKVKTQARSIGNIQPLYDGVAKSEHSGKSAFSQLDQ